MSRTYQAKCHCGDIRYTVALPEALAPEGKGTIGRCNCSICTKNGYLLVYPKREDVVFIDGCDAKLKDYFMGKMNKPHRFCPNCSSSILIDFKNSDYPKQRAHLAMNARMFKDIDLINAVFDDFDGKSKLDPPYNEE